MKIPLVGVLIYGVAEASTAYLITKVTEPPPPPSDVKEFVQEDVKWKYKKDFLNLPLDKLDKFNISSLKRDKLRPDESGKHDELKRRDFT